jgi:hypothetical protein
MELIISRSAIPVETAKYAACGVQLEGPGKTGALDCVAEPVIGRAFARPVGSQ